ncbi:hypothetical protein CGUA_07585 [Corynebacterium guangdongense]|nr:hypothetical protein CGUA_07585 [Corynebacterium guangdongense]
MGMADITTQFVPAHAALVDRREIPTVQMQSYFDSVYGHAHEVLKTAQVRPAGPARCYYFSPLGDTVDLAGGFPVRLDTVRLLQDQLADASPFKVVRHGDLRTWRLRHRGSGDGLALAWDVLAAHARKAGNGRGAIAWEEYVSIDPDSDRMTVDLHWAKA